MHYVIARFYGRSGITSWTRISGPSWYGALAPSVSVAFETFIEGFDASHLKPVKKVFKVF